MKAFVSILLFCNSVILICICTCAWSKPMVRAFWNIWVSFILSWKTPKLHKVHLELLNTAKQIILQILSNRFVSWGILKLHCKTWTAKIVFASTFGKQAQVCFKRPSRYKTCHRFSFPEIFNLRTWDVMPTHVQQPLHVYSFALLRHGNTHSSYNSQMKFST